MAATWGAAPSDADPPEPDDEFPWKVWAADRLGDPLCEGGEQACRTAVALLVDSHPGLILEDPDGREWVHHPGTPEQTA